MILETFLAALRLGLTSFGGPIAHIGYFRREYVDRRRWLDAARFGELVTLCQVLPGPASSQLGIAIGTLRAGKLGGVAAWLGFTLPSAILLTAFAVLTSSRPLGEAGWVEGLKLAAVAIVAQAVWSMGRAQAPDVRRILFGAAAAATVLAIPGATTQIGAIALGAVGGFLFLRDPDGRDDREPWSVGRWGRGSGRWRPWVLPGIYVGLLVGPGVAHRLVADQAVAVAAAFYRSGALVFGGGHVVLPLLHGAVVDPGWISEDRFLAGYGAAQAVPGPLFTFAAYLGAAFQRPPNGVVGAALAVVAIFLPSFLLVWGVLPHWDRWRGAPEIAAALRGTNAVVVGILAAALITPVGTSALHSPIEVVIAVVALGALVVGRVPPIAVVLMAALAAEVGGLA